MNQHTLKVDGKEYLIEPCAQFWGFSKVGELTNIKRTDINRVLGFAGNQTIEGRCNNKTTKIWCFKLTLPNGEIHCCQIWDYYATGQRYSVWMPKHVGEELFGNRFADVNYVCYKHLKG